MDGEICPNMEFNIPYNYVREIKLIRNFKALKTTDVTEARH